MRLIRKGLWVTALLCAALAGALWRFIRRVARRPPRIWHGFWPVHLTRDVVRAERAVGLQSRSVATHAEVLDYALLREEDFDVVLSRRAVSHDDIHWRAQIDLHFRGDIWSAYFDCLFHPPRYRWRNDVTMRLIKLAGIRIVVTSHGSDVIQTGLERSRYDWIARSQTDYPAWNYDEQTPISRMRIDTFRTFASFVIAPDPATARLIGAHDLMFKYFPADVAVVPVYPDPDVRVPVIVHAPNHRNVKGTDFLLAASERLSAAGFAHELRLVERVPRAEAQEIYRTADIIADQFCIGAFGAFALEALALGKPVLAYLDEEHLRHPALNLPIVNAVPEILADVLAVLIDVPELRARLGRAGREAVEHYQSPLPIGQVWRAIYRHVWTGEALDLGRTAHFSAERLPRSTVEDPGDERFWPVNAADLLSRIRATLDRLRRG